jgi:hypothetical protein
MRKKNSGDKNARSLRYEDKNKQRINYKVKVI